MSIAPPNAPPRASAHAPRPPNLRHRRRTAGAHRCMSREQSALKTPGDEAAGLSKYNQVYVYETSISLNSLCTSTPSRGSKTGTRYHFWSRFSGPWNRAHKTVRMSRNLRVFPARLIQKYTRSSSSDVPQSRSTPCKLSKGSSHLVPAVRLPTWFESHRITFLCPH